MTLNRPRAVNFVYNNESNTRKKEMTRNKIISNKTIKMKISPIYYHFKTSNRKLVLPFFFYLFFFFFFFLKIWVKSSQVNRPSKFWRKLNKTVFLSGIIENSFICNNAINIRIFTIYCNLKFSIKNFLFHFFTICANRPSQKFPFVRIVPGGTGFCANSPVTFRVLPFRLLSNLK